MAKKKIKKGDADKKAALVAKKEAKQEKAARKRLTKEQRTDDGGADEEFEDGGDAIRMNDHDYLDRVLQSYKKQSGGAGTADSNHPPRAVPTWEPIDTIFPLARANATLEYCTDDSKKKKSKGGDFFYLFGGEYFDGIENIVLDGLLRFDVTKQEWKVLVTPPGRPQPSPRCAHSCVNYKNHLYIFGGEVSNGDHYHHFRDLWKFNVSTLEWTEIIARDPPSPRSGHATVVWKSYMIVFGGFYEALKSDAKWYNDVHIFHLQSESWLTSANHATPIPPVSRLALKPEPRSACNMALFGTDQVMIHGGFSKYKYTGPNTLTSVTGELEVKVHSDAWVLNLAPIVQNKPPTWERWISSSTKSQLAKEHLQQQGTGTGTSTVGPRTPNGRAGTSSLSYKGNRMLVFGGVVDSEHHHHKVESVFYNDLMALDMERRKWSLLRINSKHSNNNNNKNPSSIGTEQGADRPRRKTKDDNKEDRNQQQGKGEKDDNNYKDEDDEEENDDEGSVASSAASDDVLKDEDDENTNQDMDPNKKDGWDLEDLRANMFAFMDANGNTVYEKVIEEGKVEDEKGDEEDDDEEEEEEEKEQEKQESDNDDEAEEDEEKEEEKQDKNHTTHHMKTITSSSVMKLNAETNTHEAVVRTEPLPRINSCLLLRGHLLYLWGGILEVGDREVTLDDMWSLDLRKRDHWECLWPGTMHKQVWRGAIHDDDDSYISTGNKEGSDNDEDDNEEEDDNDSDGGGSKDDNNDEQEGGKDKKKKKSKKKSSAVQQEIAALHETYGLGDEQRVPKSSESLADFYSRTTAHWNVEAARRVEGTGKELSTKELKREGFQLARERYDELRLILDRLGELELQQKETPTKKDRRESSSTITDKKEKKSKKSNK
jgi:hypothetical protein